MLADRYLSILAIWSAHGTLWSRRWEAIKARPTAGESTEMAGTKVFIGISLKTKLSLYICASPSASGQMFRNDRQNGVRRQVIGRRGLSGRSPSSRRERVSRDRFNSSEGPI
jgi:hypothetical protein